MKGRETMIVLLNESSRLLLASLAVCAGACGGAARGDQAASLADGAADVVTSDAETAADVSMPDADAPEPEVEAGPLDAGPAPLDSGWCSEAYGAVWPEQADATGAAPCNGICALVGNLGSPPPPPLPDGAPTGVGAGSDAAIYDCRTN